METTNKNMIAAVKKYLADLDFYENRLDAQEPTREMYAKHGLNISDEKLEKYHQKWRAQKAQKPQDPRPIWENYFAQKASFEKMMNEIKPTRENFATDEEFQAQMREWKQSLSMDAPNEPGYFRANND
jgi:hypothetical protein